MFDGTNSRRHSSSWHASEGSDSLHCLRDGVYLHCMDGPRASDAASRPPVTDDCLKVIVELGGHARTRANRKEASTEVGRGSHARPQGTLLFLKKPDGIEREATAGTRQRAVVVTLTGAWFAATPQLVAPTGAHLELRRWTPTRRAVAIAEQLLNPLAFRGLASGLYRESRVLELAAEAINSCSAAAEPASSGLRPEEHARLLRLRDLLDRHSGERLSMPQIAGIFSCNATTLQRQFRQTFGTTIFDYLRQSRLQRAALALAHEGTSVALAAEIAGYGSQANFSTAFRRHFGASPKNYRMRI